MYVRPYTPDIDPSSSVITAEYVWWSHLTSSCNPTYKTRQLVTDCVNDCAAVPFDMYPCWSHEGQTLVPISVTSHGLHVLLLCDLVSENDSFSDSSMDTDTLLEHHAQSPLISSPDPDLDIDASGNTTSGPATSGPANSGDANSGDGSGDPGPATPGPGTSIHLALNTPRPDSRRHIDSGFWFRIKVHVRLVPCVVGAPCSSSYILSSVSTLWKLFGIPITAYYCNDDDECVFHVMAAGAFAVDASIFARHILHKYVCTERMMCVYTDMDVSYSSEKDRITNPGFYIEKEVSAADVHHDPYNLLKVIG